MTPEAEIRPSLSTLHKIEIHPSPWESEPRTMTCEFLSRGEAIKTLEFDYPDTSVEMYNYVTSSEWYTIDNGRMYLEIRDSDVIKNKGHLAIELSDFDDCDLSTTPWHDKEQELLNTDVILNSRQAAIKPEHAKQIYEMSKVLVPGKAEHEKRYTPRLNLILLSQYAYFLPGLSQESAFNITKGICQELTGKITKEGDRFLLDMKIDEDIRNAIENNSPRDYLHKKFVSDIFGKPDNHLHIVVTRGKPEGLLGQIYKVHNSGIFEYPVDLVLYTNDLKADALLVLSKIIPGMRSAPINLYDDNPSEVLPYIKFIREKNINNMTVIHVRHADSKRKDIEVGETPLESWIDEETQTRFDVHHPNRISEV